MNSKTIRSLLPFLFCLICWLPALSQKTTIDSPVFIAARLVEKLDEEDMANLCAYYNLAEEAKEGDYSVFKDKDGTVIRFRMNGSSPYVELIPKESLGSVKKKLEKAGFTRSGDGYIRGSGLSKQVTRCSIKSSPAKLFFYKAKTDKSL